MPQNNIKIARDTYINIYKCMQNMNDAMNQFINNHNEKSEIAYLEKTLDFLNTEANSIRNMSKEVEGMQQSMNSDKIQTHKKILGMVKKYLIFVKTFLKEIFTLNFKDAYNKALQSVNAPDLNTARGKEILQLIDKTAQEVQNNINDFIKSQSGNQNNPGNQNNLENLKNIASTCELISRHVKRSSQTDLQQQSNDNDTKKPEKDKTLKSVDSIKTNLLESKSQKLARLLDRNSKNL